MSSSSRGAGSPKQRPAPASSSHKWYFTKEEMRNTASIKEGMSREEEMNYRQMAAAFIQEMIDGLNMVKDPRMKMSHTVLCAAHTHMHRFYYWHSFKKFDYRDVGAACVFLAGKCEESPRKLSHVVSVWRERKERKQLTTETAKVEAAQIIVMLESMILQTIAFDLNIELPHTKVLETMHKVDPGNQYKNLCTCAYYFATDVIAVTDWSLRYSAASMSIAIIHLMSAYANVKIDKLFYKFLTLEDGSPCAWYANFDKTMTEEKLREMEFDFLGTYRSTCKFHHASKFNFRECAAPRLLESSDRKMDRGRSNSPLVTNNHPQMPAESNGRPRGYVPKDELTVERLNKERVHEEERRKRDHDRMSGRIDNSSSSEKRARIDPLYNNFVSSTSSSTANGKLGPPPVPPLFPTTSSNHVVSSSSSSSSKSSSHRRPTEKHSNPAPTSPAFKASARAFDVAPMLTPPIAPKMQSGDHSDMDLEDGELE